MISSPANFIDGLGLPLGIEEVELEVPPLPDLAQSADLTDVPARHEHDLRIEEG